MKKLTYLIILVLGISLLHSCKKEEAGPVLDMSQTVVPVIQQPASGTVVVLIKEAADSVINFLWTPAVYGLDNLEIPKYSLQMDTVGSNFSKPVELINTTGTTYSTTVGKLNQLLVGMGAAVELPITVEFRVLAYLNTKSDYSDIFSGINSVAVTTYSDEIEVKPIYLLGDGTTVGWDNVQALEMIPIDASKFAIVETLGGGGLFIKFISTRGQWAPLWGTDDSGTSEAGPLIYRPDEPTEDPPAIPTPDNAGDYYITADTSALEYTVTKTSATLFLIGDGTPAGWDNTAGEAFNKVSPGIFTLTTDLPGGGGIKFLEISGEWAPQWGTDEGGTAQGGNLIYRPDEATQDPTNIPGPDSGGSYLIEINLITQTYKITAQ